MCSIKNNHFIEHNSRSFNKLDVVLNTLYDIFQNLCFDLKKNKWSIIHHINIFLEKAVNIFWDPARLRDYHTPCSQLLQNFRIILSKHLISRYFLFIEW